MDKISSSQNPWDNGAYSIKRHGVTISNCDSEPVQTPGCIQSHGALMVLEPETLSIVQIGENAERIFARPLSGILGSDLSTLFGQAVADRVAAFRANEPIERNPLYVMTVPAGESHGPMDLLMHSINDLVIIECEPVPDLDSPIPDYYNHVKKSVSRLQSTVTLSEFCDIAAREVRKFTGIDRVMVYKFHEDFHGEVVAESKREDLDPWLGLHYPAEDIPKPAREIFKKIWVRPLPDAAAEVMELVPLVNPVTGKPLEMTHCALRGASVMYTEYLQNMGVAASLTMSLMVDGELWGLIACQHQTPVSLPYQMRAAAEFLAQVVSLQLRSVEQRESAEHRNRIEDLHNRIIANAAQDSGLGPLTTASPNLLDPTDASGVAIFHGDRWWKVGTTPSDRQLDHLKDWLEDRLEFDSPTRPVLVTDSLSSLFPPASEYAEVASGLLALSLSRQKHTFVLWFRPETIQTVSWGGNPHDKPTVTGPHGPRLTPRKSFELFVESVSRRSLPWKQVEVESALRLRILIMELVVSRAEKISEMNADLQRANEELDAFAYVASHDLKEPLRGISKYAHQLMEAAMIEEEERRLKLDGLKRLAGRMDSLLDSLLHFSRVGRSTFHFHPVDLNESLDEALEITELRREESGSAVSIPSPLPTIQCDRMRVREIFVNLLSNAMKYSDKPDRKIEVGWFEAGDSTPVFFVRDNGIGIDLKHKEVVFKIFKRLHGRDEFGGGSGAGLAIVKRLVDQHGGTVWIESTAGEGTTFFFTLAHSEILPP